MAKKEHFCARLGAFYILLHKEMFCRLIDVVGHFLFCYFVIFLFCEFAAGLANKFRPRRGDMGGGGELGNGKFMANGDGDFLDN